LWVGDIGKQRLLDRLTDGAVVFTSSASGLHKALPALVARWKVGRLHGDWVRSDGGIGVARSLRPVVELAALLGATGVKVEGNLITGNVPSADTKFSGGVVVTSSLGDSAIAPADKRYDTKLWMRDLNEGAAYLPK
jgi:hypothetical protein